MTKDRKLDDSNHVNDDDHGDDKGAEPHKVGYGRPPKSSQFKPGQSVNLKGRTKASSSLWKTIASELLLPIEVTIDGKRRKVTKGAVIVKNLVANAMKGDARALALISRMQEKSATKEPEQQRTTRFTLVLNDGGPPPWLQNEPAADEDDYDEQDPT